MRNGAKKMSKSKTTEWTINSPITIHVQKNDVVEYATVNHRGSTVFRTNYHDKKATVILGRFEGKKIKVTPDNHVFSCEYGPRGHLSDLPHGYAGKEVTIISHDVIEEN